MSAVSQARVTHQHSAAPLHACEHSHIHLHAQARTHRHAQARTHARGLIRRVHACKHVPTASPVLAAAALPASLSAGAGIGHGGSSPLASVRARRWTCYRRCAHLPALRAWRPQRPGSRSTHPLPLGMGPCPASSTGTAHPWPQVLFLVFVFFLCCAALFRQGPPGGGARAPSARHVGAGGLI